MTKAIYDKVKRIDDKYTRQMWADIQKLVKGNYQVKKSTDNEILISIPGVKDFDIEIFPAYKINVHKFSIHLWDNRNDNIVVESEEVDSLSSIIMKVDEYLKEVPEKLKYNSI